MKEETRAQPFMFFNNGAAGGLYIYINIYIDEIHQRGAEAHPFRPINNGGEEEKKNT